jgi:hypothetical protein
MSTRRLLLEGQREDRRDVGTEGHEPDLAQGEHAGEPARQVEADGQDDEEPEIDDEALPERLAARIQHGQPDRDQDDDQKWARGPAATRHARSPSS